MKSDDLYKAMGNIDDKIIKDAEEYQAEKREHPHLRAVFYGIGVAALICSFFVLSFVLLKVSGPKTDPAATADSEAETTADLQADETEKTNTPAVTSDTEIPHTDEPDTEAPDTEAEPVQKLQDKALIKLYSNVYDGFVHIKDGRLVYRNYKGLGRNPDRVSNALPGIEALNLKETMTDGEVHEIIGRIGGSVSLSDNDMFCFWDYKTDNGYTFYLTAHHTENEDKSGFIYVFDRLPLIRLKTEVIKAELKKDGIDAETEEEYEKTLSELELLYDGYKEEYCKATEDFTKIMCGYEISCYNDPDYASELINVVFSALADYAEGKRAYTDIDYDDDLNRLVNSGFILEDFVDAVNKNNKVEDILNAVNNMYDKIRIKNKSGLILKYHETSPYTERDYLINYNNRNEYSEYVRVSTRYNAVFYYKETPGKETVYSLIYIEGGTKVPTPTQIRKNTVSANEFEESTGIKLEFSYDQTLVDIMLDRIYSHSETSEMTYRLKEPVKLNRETDDANPKKIVETDCTVYVLSAGKDYGIEKSPYVKYLYKGYPYAFPEYKNNSVTSITNVSFTTDKIKICGIGVNSSYEEFESAFAPLGLTVDKIGDTYRAYDKETGLSIGIYYRTRGDGTKERTMSMTLAPMQRSVIYY